MTPHHTKHTRKFYSLKFFTGLIVLLFLVAIASAGISGTNNALIKSTATVNNQAANVEANDAAKDSVASVNAFMNVYRVLMSPRCMNCHPAGDIPLQGDDSHEHTMKPRRGTDGRGVYAMKCSNCHQPTHTAGLHTPPGNPNWHLPPANMKMVFEGRTPHQLAKQLIDPKQNGGKNKEQLLEHAHDELVLYGWNPGEGRTLPPLKYDEFVKEWTTWIKTGAYAPNAKIKALKK